MGDQLWLAIIMLAVIVLSVFIAPAALSLQGMSSMSVYGVEIGLVAFGEMMVILSGNGGIDLSVGAMFALSQVILGVLVMHGLDVWEALFVVMVAGGILGLLNGVLVTLMKIPAIIATLGTMYVYGGIALVLTHGIDISPFPTSFDLIGQGLIAGWPVQLILIYIPVAVVLALLLSRTAFGWKLYLVGTNATAAMLNGISVTQTRLITYAITGLLCSIAAIIDASRLVTARPDAGSTMNLAAITIAVLGGTKLQGGEGRISGTILATLAITWLSYSFGLANINSVYESGTVGIVLLLAIAAQQSHRLIGAVKRLLHRRQQYV
ncbi:ABC transporter permease [Sulfobacillus thermosulfidooxidans]|uniref:ABC transporter permease n=1 Tax=Sulfobacillus thermosulfidooxidans TaxID=28034 RepID=UPI0002EE14AE|nr:ABC transporter permease [Sulfobacillus thermosulfidooxidans]